MYKRLSKWVRIETIYLGNLFCKYSLFTIANN